MKKLFCYLFICTVISLLGCNVTAWEDRTGPTYFDVGQGIWTGSVYESESGGSAHYISLYTVWEEDYTGPWLGYYPTYVRITFNGVDQISFDVRCGGGGPPFAEVFGATSGSVHKMNWSNMNEYCQVVDLLRIFEDPATNTQFSVSKIEFGFATSMMGVSFYNAKVR